MTNNVYQLTKQKPARPSALDTRSAIMQKFSDCILSSGKTYKEIGAAIDKSPSCISAIANGKTRWPRPSTVFALANYFNYKLTLTRK